MPDLYESCGQHGYSNGQVGGRFQGGLAGRWHGDGAQVGRCQPGYGDPAYVGLDGKGDVGEVDRAAVKLGVEECQVHLMTEAEIFMGMAENVENNRVVFTRV